MTTEDPRKRLHRGIFLDYCIRCGLWRWGHPVTLRASWWQYIKLCLSGYFPFARCVPVLCDECCKETGTYQ